MAERNGRTRDAAVIGPHVVVSLRAAAAWAPALRRQLRQAAIDGMAVHPFVRDVVEAFEKAASCGGETSPAKPATSSASLASSSLMSASQVAALAGVTEQAVRKAARSERLLGRRVGNAWNFEREDVQRWMEGRSA